MEEKMCSMLEIIDDDGDSFAKRAEIYFQKRPELVSFLEECFRAYQALAQRYDHLSKDLQAANKTIATVFADQVPYSIEEDDDDESAAPHKSSVGAKVRFLNKDFRSQGQVKKSCGSSKTNAVPCSGQSKDQALGEIDELQKEILEMQTERAFFYKKFREVDNQINEKQRKVCNLQVDFGDGLVTDDNETQTLMETRDLEVCQESERIRHLNRKFEAMRNKIGSSQRNLQRKDVQTKIVDNKAEEKEKRDSEVSKNIIEEKLHVNSNASHKMPLLVEKMDELLQRIVSWESAFLSEKAAEKRSKSAEEHGMSLGEDKESKIEGPGFMNSRMNMMEGELSRVKDLVTTAVDEIDILRTCSVESSHCVDNLSANAQADNKSERSSLRNKDVSAQGKSIVACKTSNEFNNYSSKDVASMEVEKAKNKYLSDTTSSIADTEIEELEIDDQEQQPNWRQLYLDGLDDNREKIKIDGYSLVIDNYKEVSKMLNEVDKRNRDGFSELAMQIRELKTALAARDGEIQTLHRKIGFFDENKYGNSVDEVVVHHGSPSEESTLTNSVQGSPSAAGQGKVGSSGKEVELETTTHKLEGNNKPAHRWSRVSALEKKIRSDIDELLEENLEFWLRFSAALNKIKKYQVSVKDLKSELPRLRERSNKQEGTTEHLKSEMRPVYCQFREIRSELTLLLENNGMMKDDIEGRYSSLCNIENEIATLVSDGELSGYQAGKFQGEVVNMKKEINKVCNELNAGSEKARQLKHEVEKLMNNLEKELGSLISSQSVKSRRTGSKIPLGSFLFGIKSSKQFRGTSSS
ncbi:hypothetical protein F3Y22_tig00006450pilonHSYRG00002 [Hibiscus syriacus]|uniref:NAB domain-containing protein n=1 Tax=Hibiscus syriacus TaxID=106335 RepID=A0A6A3CHV7_HIBSY|nr:protein NETWORKED 2A-like [Hibiscus syriacus]KAE8726709.1 hypothetical protein F3Y22_tig00006450pilonHSYRG00002 [Hibiscus syriacus]